MNNWPAKIFAIKDDGRSMLFSPIVAKEEGYIVQPLVEIDPADIIEALSEDFGISIEYVNIAKIQINLNESQDIQSSCAFATPVAMHKSHFLNEISSGVYLEAAFISSNIILLMFGSDESWIVLDSQRYQGVPSKLNQLVMISNNNIKVLHKEEQFHRFQCS